MFSYSLMSENDMRSIISNIYIDCFITGIDLQTSDPKSILNQVTSLLWKNPSADMQSGKNSLNFGH